MSILQPTMDKEELRKVYVETMIALASKDPRIVLFEADLMDALGSGKFKAAHPDRIVNCGIQEMNMMGVAAGLSLTGLVPFVHTFGSFATQRAFDQIYISGAYSGANVKILGSDSGVAAQHNGGTHMPILDGGLMRSIPEMTVIEASDAAMLRKTLPLIAAKEGMVYLRMTRKACAGIYGADEEFRIGEAKLLRTGTDVTLAASGLMLKEALDAAVLLEAQGISAEVIDMFTWKPLDAETLARSAAKTGCVVSAENHSTETGLGAACALALAERCPVPLRRLGFRDRFGQVGTADWLMETYGMTARHIAAEAALAASGRKAG